ncbi:hypothetical protein EVAR_78097_1 [Eumeta japonica]|uniref:Uncharacterized protein n=1 Tax=Eumeta variegata TaxID=151549 RepID=A0A4C1T1B0_EUMVA|nr:hypothetical protein EVAR_78097_1 [Eumeta japonica]
MIIENVGAVLGAGKRPRKSPGAELFRARLRKEDFRRPIWIVQRSDKNLDHLERVLNILYDRRVWMNCNAHSPLVLRATTIDKKARKRNAYVRRRRPSSLDVACIYTTSKARHLRSLGRPCAYVTVE